MHGAHPALRRERPVHRRMTGLELLGVRRRREPFGIVRRHPTTIRSCLDRGTPLPRQEEDAPGLARPWPRPRLGLLALIEPIATAAHSPTSLPAQKLRGSPGVSGQ